MILVCLKNKPFSILLINDVFVLPKKVQIMRPLKTTVLSHNASK